MAVRAPGRAAVLFDLGGTLLVEDSAWFEARFRELLETRGVRGAAGFTQSFRFLGLRVDPMLCEAGVDTIAYYYAAVAGGGRIDGGLAREMADAIEDAIAGSLSPLPAAKRVVEELAAAGYRLAVVSNASSQRAIEEALARSGLADYFDAIVTSRLVGVRKPDSRIFAYTLALLGAKPSEAVFIGDRGYEDVYGAKRAGLQAIHLAVAEPPSPLADAVATGLEEVPRLVSELLGTHR